MIVITLTDAEIAERLPMAKRLEEKRLAANKK